MVPTIHGRTDSEDIEVEKYESNQSLNLGESCLWGNENRRLEMFLATRKHVFEGLTESEILRTNPILQPNYSQLNARTNGVPFCNYNKNLICDKLTEKCRCMKPSILEQGRCVLPEGAGCLSIAAAGNGGSNCMNGTSCTLIGDKTSCTGYIRSLAIKIISKASFMSLDGMFQKKSISSEATIKAELETELCTCSPIP